jgi:myo-inositol 2-dehydrogenase/D-chiro-inositol 1-dehydrogenase
MTEKIRGSSTSPSRREFLKTSTVAATAGAVATYLGDLPAVHAAGSDTIRVGVIGCGGRGTGAADNAAEADPGVRIVAVGDTFKDHIDNFKHNLKEKLGDRLDLPDDRCFVGFDAFEKVLACDLEYVILATPPGFRPQHLKAAVAAGKHIFTEKPVGVDGPGIRAVLQAYEDAKKKNLSIAAGTQRRHQACYLESMKRIHGGEIGEITSARCYWNQGALWHREHEAGWSDMEWQIRNWLYFTWLSGDHICEQHVHNLDVINWALQAHPVQVAGVGGRQVRTAPVFGNIYDHFCLDYEYPNGVHVMSMCRQWEGCAGNVSEAVVGTKGSWRGSSQARDHRIQGASRWRYEGRGDRDPYVQEHIDLIASIRENKGLNELKNVAESTLTAIMGRMAAYTGQTVKWEDALNSKEDLFPDKLAWGPHPVAPVAKPGETKLI